MILGEVRNQTRSPSSHQLRTNSAAAPVRRDAILYDGTDHEGRQLLEELMREQCNRPAKETCRAFLEYAVRKDDHLPRTGEQDRIDDKTVFIIKRN